MLKLSASFLNRSSNINSSNINCSNIISSNSILTNTAFIGNKVSYDNSYNNYSPLIITNQTATGTTLNDSKPVLDLCRQGGASSSSFGARASFCLSRYENVSTNSRTLLDLKLADTTYDNITVMSVYSSGNVNMSNNLSVNNITLQSQGKINFINNNNYIQISQPTNTFTLNSENIISFKINSTSVDKAVIDTNGLTINNAVLTINDSTTVNYDLNVGGTITCANRWFSITQNFTINRPGVYIAQFYFNATNLIIYNNTFLLDAKIVNSNDEIVDSVSKGFTAIVSHLANQNPPIIHYIYNPAGTDWNWYIAYSGWYDALNIYINGTDLNFKCILTINIF